MGVEGLVGAERFERVEGVGDVEMVEVVERVMLQSCSEQPVHAVMALGSVQ